MAKLVKCAQSAFDIDELKLTPPQAPKGEALFFRAGEDVYVWTAETMQGNGLRIRGRVASSSADEVRFRSVTLLRTPVLANADIERHREIRDGTLLSYLGERLYYFAHRRTYSVPPQIAEELDQLFEAAT